MKIAILGTRGIPNHYGGFEQCAEHLAPGLVEKGFEVIVYNSSDHPWKEPYWRGVQIVHCQDPEKRWGTFGQFIYDLNCIRDLRSRGCDIILQLGYTSSSVWGWLLPKRAVVTTNMDGLEWMRAKYSAPVRRFLRFAEKLAVRRSHHLVADAIGIRQYLLEKYGREAVFIPYGARLLQQASEALLGKYGLAACGYDLLVARLEPENSIDTILEGVRQAATGRPFLVVGNQGTAYGRYLEKKFGGVPGIRFLGGIYDTDLLDNLRHFSRLYFHGHTVGGTNPSLLEAMACGALICASDNVFNAGVLGADALYFRSAAEVAEHLRNVQREDERHLRFIGNNRQKIRDIYAWEKIVDAYAAHFEAIARS